MRKIDTACVVEGAYVKVVTLVHVRREKFVALAAFQQFLAFLCSLGK